MMPMYARGYVTYGTVLSTLIATLGDSAFVLFGATIQDPSLLEPVLAVHLISFMLECRGGMVQIILRLRHLDPWADSVFAMPINY
jgi:hypothetical protein